MWLPERIKFNYLNSLSYFLKLKFKSLFNNAEKE